MPFLNMLILGAGALFGFTQWQKMKKKTPDERPRPEEKFKGGGEPTRGRP